VFKNVYKGDLMTESNKRQKTKQAIENAMVQLLTEQPFDQISTVKLAETAGISRSSFYTHYKDKYDMIDHYQSRLFHTLEYIFGKYTDNKQQVLLEIFEYLHSEPLLAALLTENGTKEIQNFLRNKLLILLKTDILTRSANRPLNETDLEYCGVYLANALFGVCQIWIAHGKKESPQEITDFLFPLTNAVSEVFSKK
jgi:transcriptional regulator, tetR family